MRWGAEAKNWWGGLRTPKPGSRLLLAHLEGDTGLGQSPTEEKYKKNKMGEWEREKMHEALADSPPLMRLRSKRRDVGEA